jgi:hypothetical protein
MRLRCDDKVQELRMREAVFGNILEEVLHTDVKRCYYDAQQEAEEEALGRERTCAEKFPTVKPADFSKYHTSDPARLHTPQDHLRTRTRGEFLRTLFRTKGLVGGDPTLGARRRHHREVAEAAAASEKAHARGKARGLRGHELGGGRGRGLAGRPM